MASIVNDEGGRKRISFKGADAKRRSIRLGRVPDRLAREVCDMVGRIVACLHAPHLLTQDVFDWAATLPPDLYDKIARAGVLPARDNKVVIGHTIDELVRDVAAEIAHKKPLTKSNYARIFDLLTEYFTGGRSVSTITAREADTFVSWLRNEKKQGPATVARRIKGYRYIFRRAIRWEWVTSNPFDGIKAGSSINHARKRFVPTADVEKIMEATPDLEFRAVIALSRYGALRCPSEVNVLRWADVQWDEGILVVRSSKTEHHAGGEVRQVPLFTPLRRILLDWFEAAPEGEEFIASSFREPGKNYRTRLTRLIELVGLKAWPKLFQNMRASRESELLRQYPLVTVCKWLGHRPEVAAAHYLIDTDKDANFRDAAGLDDLEATRQATRAGGETEESRAHWGPIDPTQLQESSTNNRYADLVDCARRAQNNPAKQGQIAQSIAGDAQSDARDPVLTQLIEVWTVLPPDVRAQIGRLITRSETA